MFLSCLCTVYKTPSLMKINRGHLILLTPPLVGNYLAYRLILYVINLYTKSSNLKCPASPILRTKFLTGHLTLITLSLELVCYS